MVSKTFRGLLEGINSTANKTLHGITSQSGISEKESHAVAANLSLHLEQENQTSFYNIQTVTDIYQSISTTLITSDVDNSTQSTMTRNIVSAFTINNPNLLDKPHHNIMVAILLGIFTCISLTLTVSIFVFCRKKNSVFMLQKCEQDSDIDLEMNDMNTEIETSDSEYEFIESTSPENLNSRSQTCPNLTKCINENTKEENGKLYSDWFSTSRRSINRHKRDSSNSPTSTPLLNSVSQTSLTSDKETWKHLRDKSRQCLSLHFTNDTNCTAEKYSGNKVNQSKRRHSFTEDGRLTSLSVKRQTKPGKTKHSGNKRRLQQKVRNSEHGFVEIKVKNSVNSEKHSQEKAKKKYMFHVKGMDQNVQKPDSNILRMESMGEGSDCFSVNDLLEENDTHRISDIKLEML